MKPALSQVCSLDSTLEKDVEDYAAGQCRAIEFWLTKLETYLQSHSVDQLRDLLQQHEVTPAAASWQGGLLTSQGPARAEAWDLFRERLKLCQQIGIETIVVACDVVGPLGPEDFARLQASLREAATAAEENEVRVALEFQARAMFGNNLQTAAALVEEVGSRHLGLCLDAFHYWVGPSKSQDLECLNNDNLFLVQLCDLADVPREAATDSDRILPGDGDIPLAQIVDRLREIDYRGYVSMELMNPQIWRVPALQFGEIGMTALRKVLGLASMEEAVQ